MIIKIDMYQVTTVTTHMIYAGSIFKLQQLKVSLYYLIVIGQV